MIYFVLIFVNSCGPTNVTFEIVNKDFFHVSI